MILGIIQARMSSSRLPGKVLMPLLGTPILLFMVRRVMESKKIDLLYVATSKDKTDDAIREVCHKNKVLCFSDELNDVLSRFYWLAQIHCPEHIIRLTADCPLIDPDHIDTVISHHIKGGYDYTRDYGWPDGLDVECITFKALCCAWREARSDYDREHVTSYFYSNPNLFNLGRLENEIDQSNIKISIDTPEDYLKIERMLEIAIWPNSTFQIQNPY